MGRACIASHRLNTQQFSERTKGHKKTVDFDGGEVNIYLVQRTAEHRTGRNSGAPKEGTDD